MSTLRLRVNQMIGVTASPDARVIANIYPLPETGAPATVGQKAIRNILVPAGPAGNANFEEVTLDPGRYLVEAVLPSGYVSQKEVRIEAGAGPAQIELQGEESEHEWLSAQQFYGTLQSSARATGGMVSAPHLFDAQVSAVPTVQVINIAPNHPARELPLASSRPGDLASRGLFFAMPEANALKPGQTLPFQFPGTPDEKPTFASRLLTPIYQETASFIYQLSLDKDCFLPHLLPWNGQYQTDQWERHYLFVSGDNVPPQYAVLPVPWVQTEGGHEMQVEAVLQTKDLDQPSPGFDQGYRLAVAVNDPVVGSMIGYLGSGRVEAARSIIRQARDHLWQKQVNPLAAAAGAYVMIADWDPGEADFWHAWVYNLMAWFPWLPDGAIQHAWLLLKGQRNAASLQEARQALLEGFRRGIPFFSKGVSLLLDGLSLFLNDARQSHTPDVEVEQALKIVRPMALRTNMRQPFTTVLIH